MRHRLAVILGLAVCAVLAGARSFTALLDRIEITVRSSPPARCMPSRGAGTDQALAALGKRQRATSDAIQQWAKTVAIDAADRESLLDRVAALHADLESEIREHAPSAPASVGVAGAEPVLVQLEELLAGRASRRDPGFTPASHGCAWLLPHCGYGSG